jgi:signal transduction histidine kinase
VKTIYAKAEQLLSLISGLLDLGKLESGTMHMVLRPVRIESLLSDVASTLAPTARKKEVRIELSAARDLPEVRGDAERLRQVLLNLVENSLKFTPAGGSVTISARLVDEDASGPVDEEGLTLLAPMRARLELRVSDTGIGIPPRERSKVFDPFYQVDSSSTRHYGGTGLGLSIVKRLVAAHSGSIRIEDNVPKGTVFVVSLPQQGPSQQAHANG